MLGKDSENARKALEVCETVERGEKWNTWEQSIPLRAKQSRPDSVNGAGPPLFLKYAWTDHISKHFPSSLTIQIRR